MCESTIIYTGPLIWNERPETCKSNVTSRTVYAFAEYGIFPRLGRLPFALAGESNLALSHHRSNSDETQVPFIY
jgi:hypothetical protein